MKTEVFTPRRRKHSGRHGPHEARGPCDAVRLRLQVKIPRRLASKVGNPPTGGDLNLPTCKFNRVV